MPTKPLGMDLMRIDCTPPSPVYTANKLRGSGSPGGWCMNANISTIDCTQESLFWYQPGQYSNSAHFITEQSVQYTCVHVWEYTKCHREWAHHICYMHILRTAHVLYMYVCMHACARTCVCERERETVCAIRIIGKHITYEWSHANKATYWWSPAEHPLLPSLQAS